MSGVYDEGMLPGHVHHAEEDVDERADAEVPEHEVPEREDPETSAPDDRTPDDQTSDHPAPGEDGAERHR